MAEILLKHRETWNKKKIIRLIYTAWYKMILADLSPVPGKTLELGAGSGNFKEFKPDVISADIEPCDWLDMAFDAHKMPFENAGVANIVMVDVLHHLSNPVLFLNEACRVLKSGGRLIILEPFPTFFSLIVYRKFHPEPFIFDVDYYSKGNEIEQKDPWDSNQAIAYLLFYKGLGNFNSEFGNKFKMIRRRRMSCVLYPASGGFENKALIPDFMIPPFRLMEFLFIPLRQWFAFRTYIVLEKV